MRVGAASIALLLALLGATPVATRKPSWEIAVVSDTGLMGPAEPVNVFETVGIGIY
jgi:hypothetical protein